MRFFAFLFFLIEAVFIYLFVDKFGFLNYFLEVLVSGFVGIALLFNAGFSSLNSPQVAFKSFLGGNLFSQLGPVSYTHLRGIRGRLRNSSPLVSLLNKRAYKFKVVISKIEIYYLSNFKITFTRKN